MSERAGVIAEAIEGGFPDWTAGMRSLPCRIPLGPVSGTFATTWDTLGDNVFAAGTATLNLELDGQTLVFQDIGARAGTTASGVDRLQIVADTAEARRFTITSNFPDPRFFESFMTPGEHELIGPPVTMNATEQDRSVSPVVTLRRLEIGEGTWTFEEVSDRPGAAIVGSFQGTLYLRP